VARRSDQRTEPAGDNGRALRTLALIAVVVGLIALTTAACVLSYSSVHAFALRADVSRSLARIYPYACDAMLVLAGCSVLALRGAGLISRVYGWLCFIVLLATLAASSVAHVAGLNMPKRAAEITVAVFPWALVLVAFGLLLALLRHARRRRLSQRASSALNGIVVPLPAAIEPPAREPGSLEATPFGQAELDQAEFEEAQFAQARSGPAGFGSVGTEPQTVEFAARESTYEPFGPIMHEATSATGALSPHAAASDPTNPDPNTSGVAVPLPRQGDASVDQPKQPPKAVLRPTEMQLRARTQRPTSTADPQPTVSHAPDTVPNLTPPPAGDGHTGGAGHTGDTIPRGELSPAPITDSAADPADDTAADEADDVSDGNSTPATTQRHPPELDRPRSSPTPPSD
jgi:hypothetical protein